MNGDLKTGPVYSISQITRKIKGALENNVEFNNIWIKGEIYNLTYHSSGHIYFSLKDDHSIISVVFFKYANRKLKFKLEDGMSIFALGNITVFEKRGSYQINVVDVKLEGIGELQKRIEQLKKKLTDEKIFDSVNKKPLPMLPEKIGIVTSPTGAAVRDIIKVTLRRYPNIEIIIAPANVQGDAAAESIIEGIRELNNSNWEVDVIIVGRGGGSFEDLMPFNDEGVIRAVFDSKIPVISAVGHQIDHPLTDDAADVYAATPSVAAELAVPLKKDFKDEIEYYLMRINNGIEKLLNDFKTRIANITEKRIFTDPMELIHLRELYLADIKNKIIAFMKDIISENRIRLLKAADLNGLINNIIRNKSHCFDIAIQAMDKLSPLNVMKRGYSITKNISGDIIKSVNMVCMGDDVKIQFIDGSVKCLVKSKEVIKNFGKKKKSKK